MCVRLIDLRKRAPFGRYYRDYFSTLSSGDIDVYNRNYVDSVSDHGDNVIVHLRCLCDFSLLSYEDNPLAACLFRRYAAILLIGPYFI